MGLGRHKEVVAIAFWKPLWADTMTESCTLKCPAESSLLSLFFSSHTRCFSPLVLLATSSARPTSRGHSFSQTSPPATLICSHDGGTGPRDAPARPGCQWTSCCRLANGSAPILPSSSGLSLPSSSPNYKV